MKYKDKLNIIELKHNYHKIIRNVDYYYIKNIFIMICKYFSNKYYNIPIDKFELNIIDKMIITFKKDKYYILIIISYLKNNIIKKDINFVVPYNIDYFYMYRLLNNFIFISYKNKNKFSEYDRINKKIKYNICIFKNEKKNNKLKILKTIIKNFNYYFLGSDLYEKIQQHENPWLIKDLKNLLLTFI